MSRPSPWDTVRSRVSAWSVVWLTLVWMLLWGSFGWVDLAAGLLLALVLVLVFPMPRLQVAVTLRPTALLRLLLLFLRDLVVASAQVLWMALFSRERHGGSLFEVPLRSTEELFVTTTAGFTTLVPGSVVVDIDRTRSVLLLHALDVYTAEEQADFRQKVLRQEERILRAFDRDAERTLASGPGGPLDDDSMLQSEAVGSTPLDTVKEETR
ncbi:multisubunit sodium/proton antiporter, MrpE subunit [Kytococcus aerolatus]|uniref:Multisubunit sodium/proton antiporter, MrpE subunit n=1 Tax=Kytococcus aerolatus TaxID=592308 RepID=A0A212U535_9MICO|nr:Na+/H+ antiporter subunit E [Kytococcus aerolatus]SNC73372.1 multisubunit sodium/proton antiporter, MrpE subunit [Kytococcus aerolatus]